MYSPKPGITQYLVTAYPLRSTYDQVVLDATADGVVPIDRKLPSDRVLAQGHWGLVPTRLSHTCHQTIGTREDESLLSASAAADERCLGIATLVLCPRGRSGGRS